MYKISIILPTFNVEKYIQRCFDSIVKQTIGFENMQIIFVDDCSTDNSCEIIDGYAKEYENVLSIHLPENSGYAGRPRNEGMKFAFADYLLFLDPDDILMPDACEVLYNKIIESNADIVVGGYKKQDWTAYWKSLLRADETLIENTKDSLAVYFNPPGLVARLFKKEFLLKNDIEFPEGLPAQDLVFLTESYLKANSILSLNNFIVHEYYVREDKENKSVTQNITKKYLYELLEAYNLVMDLLEEFNVNNLLRKLYFTKNHFNFFRVQLIQLNMTEKELSELFSSELFLKFRNQEFILEDERLNNFFDQLIENPKSVERKTLQSICRQTKKEFIKSDAFSVEVAYNYSEDRTSEDDSIEDIEKELYSFIKRNAELYNTIKDSKII